MLDILSYSRSVSGYSIVPEHSSKLAESSVSTKIDHLHLLSKQQKHCLSQIRSCRRPIVVNKVRLFLSYNDLHSSDAMKEKKGVAVNLSESTESGIDFMKRRHNAIPYTSLKPM